jgi:hypothetical protein
MLRPTVEPAYKDLLRASYLIILVETFTREIRL